MPRLTTNADHWAAHDLQDVTDDLNAESEVVAAAATSLHPKPHADSGKTSVAIGTGDHHFARGSTGDHPFARGSTMESFSSGDDHVTVLQLMNLEPASARTKVPPMLTGRSADDSALQSLLQERRPLGLSPNCMSPFRGEVDLRTVVSCDMPRTALGTAFHARVAPALGVAPALEREKSRSASPGPQPQRVSVRSPAEASAAALDPPAYGSESSEYHMDEDADGPFDVVKWVRDLSHARVRGASSPTPGLQVSRTQDSESIAGLLRTGGQDEVFDDEEAH